MSFHAEFLVDFVVTGAQLFGRQLAIPGTLLQDLQNGRPLHIAVGRALQTFAEVELDADRELVGFAEEYVDFQARIFVDLFSAPFLRDVVVSVAAVPIAAARGCPRSRRRRCAAAGFGSHGSRAGHADGISERADKPHNAAGNDRRRRNLAIC